MCLISFEDAINGISSGAYDECVERNQPYIRYDTGLDYKVEFDSVRNGVRVNLKGQCGTHRAILGIQVDGILSYSPHRNPVGTVATYRGKSPRIIEHINCLQELCLNSDKFATDDNFRTAQLPCSLCGFLICVDCTVSCKKKALGLFVPFVGLMHRGTCRKCYIKAVFDETNKTSFLYAC